MKRVRPSYGGHELPRASDAFKEEQVESSQVDRGLQSLFSFIHITQIPKGLFSSDV